MFESVRHCLWWIALAALLGVRPAIARDDRLPASGRTGRAEEARLSQKVRRGQHGGDLRLLLSFYHPPRHPSESNHFFDLWEPRSLANFAAVQGLTNNRALIIDSHGLDQFSWSGLQYVFRPNARALRPGAELPTYSIRDLARVMGSGAAATIHNVFVAGCNENGALKASEFRRHFVNATNITYMAAGHLAYKPSFYQALTRHSEEIEPLFGYPVADDGEQVKMAISRRPGPGAVVLGVYVSELYERGAARPYRRQQAGRELLDPGFPPQTSFR